MFPDEDRHGRARRGTLIEKGAGGLPQQLVDPVTAAVNVGTVVNATPEIRSKVSTLRPVRRHHPGTRKSGRRQNSRKLRGRCCLEAQAIWPLVGERLQSRCCVAQPVETGALANGGEMTCASRQQRPRSLRRFCRRPGFSRSPIDWRRTGRSVLTLERFPVSRVDEPLQR